MKSVFDLEAVLATFLTQSLAGIVTSASDLKEVGVHNVHIWFIHIGDHLEKALGQNALMAIMVLLHYGK